MGATVPEEARIRGALGHYLPWAVLVLGLAISIGVSQIIASHEHVEVGWATQLAAEAIRTDLREDMEWQRIGLDRLALLWGDTEPPQRLWIENAELYIQHRPGCVAVERILPNGTIQGLVTSGRPSPILGYGGLPKAAMDAAKNARAAVYSNPTAVADGVVQFAIAYPVYVNDDLRGYIVSFFDAARAIDENLGDVRGLGFSFAISLPGQPDYVMPGMNREYETDWGQTFEAAFPGATWHIRVWPNPDALYRIRSALPEVTLVLGIVLSFLAFLTFYFGIGIIRASARGRTANEALQREIAVREGTEKELRRAHDELDARVSERTAALASTNTLLEREVSEHRRAEELLRELTGRLFHLQDEERRHLARELHDGAVQNLVALAIDMGVIREGVAECDASTKQAVSECVLLIEQATKELRTISYLLHPPYFDELGLKSALRDFVEGFANRSGIAITLDIDPRLSRLPREFELTIYRVVQEALSNIHRHAHSPTARILIGCEAGLIRVEVADAGRGIPTNILDPESHTLAGVGIAGMRERVRLVGGRLEVHTGDSGTTIEALLPVEAPESKLKPASDVAESDPHSSVPLVRMN